VEQVVLNLLSNAVKFTERGSVTLRAEPASLPGARGAKTAAVRIAVSDTGIGIRDEDRELLFRPFRQIDSRLSREHEGTGLGLSICRRLCELMKGTIDVHSRWQQGSTFTVTLPLEVLEP
jgi:signal transduction histidine kinase